MRERYLDLSPHNLVRVILGAPRPGDSASSNVYTRAAEHFTTWIRDGVLARDSEPAFYPYFQEFTVPGSGERAVRRGFIGLTAVEPYEAKAVFRHEHTHPGPKKDRLQVLEHTRAHFGQIFMLYPGRDAAVDRLLDAAAASQAPLADVADEYGVAHRLWRIADPGVVKAIQGLMADKPLLIADGHHRYETSLAFRAAHPELPGAAFTMATFINMHAPELRILATHRVVRSLPGFSSAPFLDKLRDRFTVVETSDRAALAGVMGRRPAASEVRIGFVPADTGKSFQLTRPRKPGELDVDVLHREILGGILGVSEAQVAGEFLHYVRGVDAAIAEVESNGGAAAFLLDPVQVTEVADIAFAGGVMPQKSTDFYPKLLTGMAIYKVDEPA